MPFRFLFLAGALATGGLSLATAQTVIVIDSFNAPASATPTSGAVVAGRTWVGAVTQNAGSITVGSPARDDNGYGSTALAVNATGTAYVRITAQRDTGNVNPNLVVQFEDSALTPDAGIFSVPTSAFRVGALTTVQIPISSWGTGFDFSDITGYSIGGGAAGTTAFRMTIEHLELGSTLLPLNGGTIITAGNQVYTTAQVLGGSTVLGNTAGANLSGTAITFDATIDGAHGLTLNNSGATTLKGAVGGTTALASLETDAGGTTAINGGKVRTTGSQTYRDAVSLGSNTLIQTIGDGIVNFFEAITGNGYALEIDTLGQGTLATASGLSSFKKTGSGTITFSGESTYTGPTIINAGALALGRSNAIASSSALTLGGGKLSLAGYVQSFSSLAVAANSTIDFGAGSASLTFGSSATQTWSGTVTISNYSSSLNLLQFGSTAAALTTQQLGLLRFADYGNAAGQISALGVVTPLSAIPEPSTYAALAGLAVLGCAWRRRRSVG